MQFSDETLMAYADGELSPQDAKRIDDAIKADPALASRVERFRAVRSALRAAYDSVVNEPVPDRLRALLHDVELSEPTPKAPVVDLAAAREKKRAAFGPPAWAAVAATLVLGVLFGRMSAPDSLFIADAGQVRAGAELTRVLNTRLASAADNENADLRVGLSFRAQDGAYCRTFSGAESGDSIAGLACREGDDWAIRVAASAPAASGDFRLASAESTVMDAVDAIIAGEALTAAQETEARDNNWR